MSKIDELLKKYCPNGVQFITFEEVCNYEQPGKYIVESTNYSDDYTTPVLTAGQTFILGYTDETEGIYQASKSNPVIIFDDFTGAFKWVDFPFKVKSSAMKLLTPNGKALLRYIFHYMGCLNFSSDEHKRLWIATYSKFKIPVPPLEVQREIVQVLDSFTMLTAELSAELSARKKQYEYYRDQLLSFNNVRGGLTFANPESVRWMTLGEICKNICSGGTPLKGNSEFYENGTIPWLRTQEVVFNEITKTECFITEAAVKKTSAKWIPANCVIVAISGASAGRCAINKIPLTTNQHCLNMEINSNVAHYKYVFYCVQNQYNELLDKKEGARGDLNASRIKSLKIPVPSLAMQEKIANVLDNFDAVCNDLNIGLPAEIALRKKQYEYYRDRILSSDTNVNNSIHGGGGNLQDEIKLLQYVFGYAMVRLGDIATQFRGEYITQKNSKKGEIPVILGGLEPAYYIDKPNHYGEIIVVSRSGASAGFVSQWNEPIFITDGFGFEAKKEITSHKFLYYSLKNRERNLNEMKRGAGVPHVSGEMLNDVVFPIPSITEQERIVAILDKFDALVNDLSQGIPAEIEARKKQYEYYRDKLLNFKSKVA